MGLLGRWADKLEHKNVLSATEEILSELSCRFNPDKGLGLQQLRSHMLTRRGWTEELWNAVVEVLETIESSDYIVSQIYDDRDSFIVLLLAFTDNNYARAGVGKKLATSPMPLFDTTQVANDIGQKFGAYLVRASKKV